MTGEAAAASKTGRGDLLASLGTNVDFVLKYLDFALKCLDVLLKIFDLFVENVGFCRFSTEILAMAKAEVSTQTIDLCQINPTTT